MAKRFTDTEKWSKPWFRKLSPKWKLAWLYVCDNCDHAGVWPGDFDLMSFQTGETFSMSEFEKTFGLKIRRVEGGKYFIAPFVEFQYGELNPENNAHKGVLRVLSKLGATEPLISPTGGALDKEQDKEKEKEKEGGVGETKVVRLKAVAPSPELERIFAEYPRRKGDQGKAKAFAALSKICRTSEITERVIAAAGNYRRFCESEKQIGTTFVKQFRTWVGVWEEWENAASYGGREEPKSMTAEDIRRELAGGVES